MFRNRDKTRTHKHNMQIAMLLSLVAGFINVAGFISVGVLTTNVTGHFAFMVNDVVESHFSEGLIYGFYVISFFLGGIFAGFIFPVLHFKSLYLMAILLAFALIYDNLKYTFLKWKLNIRRHYLRKE